MKTSLDHLPERHQDNLEIIKEAIVEQVNPEMIILFGSYARGDYVEHDYTHEDGITYEYNSDYDILIVAEKKLNNEKLRAVKKRIARKHLLTPTAIISHGISFLNEQITDSYYFFVDVLKEGIMLYDTGKYQLATPQRLRPEKKLAKAREQFEYWMKKAESFFRQYNYGVKDKDYSTAAFLLHQVVECCYNTFLLVFTDYKPKTHELEELRKMAIQIHKGHTEIFAIKNQKEEDRWVLLCKAYIDGRYRKDYNITLEDLEYLAEQVELLIEFVKKLCQKELGGLLSSSE